MSSLSPTSGTVQAHGRLWTPFMEGVSHQVDRVKSAFLNRLRTSKEGPKNDCGVIYPHAHRHSWPPPMPAGG
jgi:hypothetical protein